MPDEPMCQNHPDRPATDVHIFPPGTLAFCPECDEEWRKEADKHIAGFEGRN